jgi:hypothetical protein
MEEEAYQAPPPEPAPIEPEGALLSYGDLVLASWEESTRRGRLRRSGWKDRLVGLPADHADRAARQVALAESQARAVGSQGLPPGTTRVEDSTGLYDHRYQAEGLVDVPNDGQFHNVPLFSQDAPIETRLVVVPREGDQAVRLALLKNPLDRPLLEGPADIYLEDEFLVTSPLRTVPATGELKLGLGVEPALKVARNSHFDEEVHGLLGGGVTLRHRVEIEVASRLPEAAVVEVRERVPIQDEHNKDIEITVVGAEPPWEDYDQHETSLIEGGKRWIVSLPAGQSKKLKFGYTVRIDGKNELVGGNRRES